MQRPMSLAVRMLLVNGSVRIVVFIDRSPVPSRVSTHM